MHGRPHMPYGLTMHWSLIWISSQEGCCCCYNCKSPTHKHKKNPDPAFRYWNYLQENGTLTWITLTTDHELCYQPAAERDGWEARLFIYLFITFTCWPSHCQATLVNNFINCCFGSEQVNQWFFRTVPIPHCQYGKYITLLVGIQISVLLFPSPSPFLFWGA